MFAPEPEIVLLRHTVNRVFDRLENKLDALTIKQNEQEHQLESFAEKQDEHNLLIHQLIQRIDALEAQNRVEQDRHNEIEHLVNPYSDEGQPICNFSTRWLDDDEV
ncbi:hypothetical protein [Alkalinema sp. FACHB-956]|uniref:hypothetical protein n=1 Tax=Alkalinema sp. FACHB-956 TaxID=2692768 RepID=UPI001688D76E|nr:hypothetical protein [Alkalinema sp. FACHB-956]MBD2329207.1 hypothetical protein [Alkalinema sp. FACHB-956]